MIAHVYACVSFFFVFLFVPMINRTQFVPFIELCTKSMRKNTTSFVWLTKRRFNVSFLVQTMSSYARHQIVRLKNIIDPNDGRTCWVCVRKQDKRNTRDFYSSIATWPSVTSLIKTGPCLTGKLTLECGSNFETEVFWWTSSISVVDDESESWHSSLEKFGDQTVLGRTSMTIESNGYHRWQSVGDDHLLSFDGHFN